MENLSENPKCWNCGQSLEGVPEENPIPENVDHDKYCGLCGQLLPKAPELGLAFFQGKKVMAANDTLVITFALRMEDGSTRPEEVRISILDLWKQLTGR